MPNEVNNRITTLTATNIREMMERLVTQETRAFTNIDYRTYTTNVDSYDDKPKETMREYKDDEQVTTKKGEKLLFKDCVIIGDSIYSKKDPDLVEDCFSKKLILKVKSKTIYLNFTEDGFLNRDNPSYYIPNFRTPSGLPEEVVKIYDTYDEFLVPYNTIPKEHYIECIHTGIFYHRNTNPNPAITVKYHKTKFRKAKETTSIKDYDLKDPEDLKLAYKAGVKSPTFSKFEGKQYTFGIEMECSSGRVPVYLDKDLNYESVRDGSLKHDDDGVEYGGEYITGILTGDTGLLQTKRLCDTLTKYCMVNKKCGYHVHLGKKGNFSNEDIVFMYRLFQMVEEEIFSMMPLSRRNNEYCKKLKKFNLNFTEESLNNPNEYNSLIEQYYNIIYGYVAATEDTPSRDANKKTQHPLGAKCSYNHATARYCWLNLVPTIFDTRGNGIQTVELRNHPGTTNYIKVKNYLMVFMALIWFVENHKRTIALNDTISLRYIIELAYPKQCDKLMNYIKMRIDKFNTKDSEQNSQIEQLDYQEVIENNNLSLKEL